MGHSVEGCDSLICVRAFMTLSCRVSGPVTQWPRLSFDILNLPGTRAPNPKHQAVNIPKNASPALQLTQGT